MKTYIDWEPVGDFGCGNPYDCPTCTPKVLEARELKHRKRVESTWPRSTPADQVSAWYGDLYGTTGERDTKVKAPTARTPAEKKLALACREQGTAKVRVKRTLSVAHETRAARLIDQKSNILRRAYLRKDATGQYVALEWLTEAWLELLSPSKLVAHRERHLGIDDRVERAISRSEYNMRSAARALKREHAAEGSN